MPEARNNIPRSWWTDVTPADLEAEHAWLSELYAAHGHVVDPARLPHRQITAHERWRADPLSR